MQSGPAPAVRIVIERKVFLFINYQRYFILLIMLHILNATTPPKKKDVVDNNTHSSDKNPYLLRT
jgi:hypothetical protein